jgi:hypothetical protein
MCNMQASQKSSPPTPAAAHALPLLLLLLLLPLLLLQFQTFFSVDSTIYGQPHLTVCCL